MSEVALKIENPEDAPNNSYDVSSGKALSPHLQALEDESLFMIREALSAAENPTLLYSIGKDSAVLLHLIMKAYYPVKPPLRLLHVDTRWKFKEMISFRNEIAEKTGLDLIVHTNPDGIRDDISPVKDGSRVHTHVMKTEALKQILNKEKFDVIFIGARRDEEKSRAKERVFSVRNRFHAWDPKNQRPEFGSLYNNRLPQKHSVRVSPLSNWTEYDIWDYINSQNVPVVPLYFAKERPTVIRDDTIIMVDDERLPVEDGEVKNRKIRFRTLGCYPLTGAMESDASNVDEIVTELGLRKDSERGGRLIDKDAGNSMESKKKEGYF